MDHNLKRFDMVLPGSPQYNNRTELIVSQVIPFAPIVGHLSLDIFDDYTAITWVYVDNYFRGNGIASALLEEAWNITVEHDITIMGLIVDKSPVQSKLVEFYQKKGFELTGDITENGGINMRRNK